MSAAGIDEHKDYEYGKQKIRVRRFSVLGEDGSIWAVLLDAWESLDGVGVEDPVRPTLFDTTDGTWWKGLNPKAQRYHIERSLPSVALRTYSRVHYAWVEDPRGKRRR